MHLGRCNCCTRNTDMVDCLQIPWDLVAHSLDMDFINSSTLTSFNINKTKKKTLSRISLNTSIAFSFSCLLNYSEKRKKLRVGFWWNNGIHQNAPECDGLIVNSMVTFSPLVTFYYTTRKWDSFATPRYHDLCVYVCALCYVRVFFADNFSTVDTCSSNACNNIGKGFFYLSV